MKFKNDMNEKEKFRQMIREKLPKSLEVHKVDGDFYTHWEIRPKGFFLNFWRPAVWIDSGDKSFEVDEFKSIRLAQRLAKIFPDIKITSKKPDVVVFLREEKIIF